MGGPGNTIGSSASRNVISGNTTSGIGLDGADNTVIIGNFVGTDITGQLSIPNQTNGIEVKDSFDNHIGGANNERNLVSGNTQNGIYIYGNTSVNNWVTGNIIGTRSDGTTALPNNGSGIRVEADENIIGTNSDGNGDEAEGNVTSSNGMHGVYVSGSNNRIAANRIQSSLSGSGVVIEGGFQNTVGGVSDAARNVIGGNAASGVSISGLNATQLAAENYVLGNFIGLDADGSTPRANGKGVFVGEFTLQNRIGQMFSGPGFETKANVISGNSTDGIALAGGTQNTVYGNSIGTDSTGRFRRGNTFGIVVSSGTEHAISSNVVSGNYSTSFGQPNAGGGIYIGNG